VVELPHSSTVGGPLSLVDIDWPIEDPRSYRPGGDAYLLPMSRRPSLEGKGQTLVVVLLAHL
jgi:hypothetical protein